MRLFHVSDVPAISNFEPRPSPSAFPALRGDVVFAIEERLLHHYLLPRDCPRVGFYAGPATTDEDVNWFLVGDRDRYVLAIEVGWMERVRRGAIYVYELPVEGFELLDDCAGYWVSYRAVQPLGMEVVDDIPGALVARDIDFRVMATLWPLANEVRASSLQFSLIRMRNAYCG